MSFLTPVRYCAVGEVCVLSSITGLRSPATAGNQERTRKACRPTGASSDISTRRYDLSVNRVPSSRNKTPAPSLRPREKSLPAARQAEQSRVFLADTSIVCDDLSIYCRGHLNAFSAAKREYCQIYY